MEVLGSRPKVMLLALLIEKEEMNITALVKESGLSYRTAEAHLKELGESGLITEKRFGKIRIIKIKKGDPRITSLRKLLSEWKEPSIRI